MLCNCRVVLTSYLIIMLIPVLQLRYAGTPIPDSFGHPFAGDLFIGLSMFSEPASVEVPLDRNNNRGLVDLSKRGTKVSVTICEPTVLTLHVLFQAWRRDILPEATSGSNCAPNIVMRTCEDPFIMRCSSTLFSH